jgi:hypothetical protein
LTGEEGPSVAQAAIIDSAADTKTICAECPILTMLISLRSHCAVFWAMIADRFDRAGSTG